MKNKKVSMDDLMELIGDMAMRAENEPDFAEDALFILRTIAETKPTNEDLKKALETIEYYYNDIVPGEVVSDNNEPGWNVEITLAPDVDANSVINTAREELLNTLLRMKDRGLFPPRYKLFDISISDIIKHRILKNLNNIEDVIAYLESLLSYNSLDDLLEDLHNNQYYFDFETLVEKDLDEAKKKIKEAIEELKKLKQIQLNVS